MVKCATSLFNSFHMSNVARQVARFRCSFYCIYLLFLLLHPVTECCGNTVIDWHSVQYSQVLYSCRGLLRISSDRDDQMGPKIKT